MFIEYRKVLSTRGSGGGEKAAIDYIFESEQKGEINEDNVLYIVENINVAGKDRISLARRVARTVFVVNPLFPG